MSEKIIKLHSSGYRLELSGYSDPDEIAEILRAFVVTVQVATSAPSSHISQPPDLQAAGLPLWARRFVEKTLETGDAQKHGPDGFETQPRPVKIQGGGSEPSEKAKVYYLHQGLRV